MRQKVDVLCGSGLDVHFFELSFHHYYQGKGGAKLVKTQSKNFQELQSITMEDFERMRLQMSLSTSCRVACTYQNFLAFGYLVWPMYSSSLNLFMASAFYKVGGP